MDGSSANNNGISGGPQQAHDEAISGVRSANGGAASLTLYRVADNTVKRGDEVCKDEGTLSRRCLEVQIPIVEISQARWKTWLQFVLIAINKRSYRHHLFASSFSESRANLAVKSRPSSRTVYDNYKTNNCGVIEPVLRTEVFIHRCWPEMACAQRWGTQQIGRAAKIVCVSYPGSDRARLIS